MVSYPFTNPGTLITDPTKGTLSFAPAVNASGTATITVTVMNNGGTANGGQNTIQRTFTVTVLPVNQAPTFTAITPPGSILESTSPTALTFNLTGITDGQGNSTQNFLSVNVTSSEPAVVPVTSITYPFTDPTSGTTDPSRGSFTLTPQALVSGVVTITITVSDNGSTANGGITTAQQSFTLTVTPVNQQPTFTVTPPVAIPENTTGVQTVPVSGISVGAGDTATAIATVVGGAISAITVTDGGNGYSSANLPMVTISAPTGANPIQATAVAVVNSDGVVTGITIMNAGSGYDSSSPPRVRIASGQTLTITATSNNLSLIPNPVFSFTGQGNNSGVLTYTPAQNASGIATITLSMMDSGGTLNSGMDTLTQTFNVTITPVNQAPTLDPITVLMPQILENAGQQTINLTGITTGTGDLGQSITGVFATSNNPNVIPNPTTIFPPNNSTGMLTFTPVPFASGSATITVTVMDNGGTVGGGVNFTTQSFTIAVLPVNQAPTLNPIPNPAALLENATLQTVTLGGIAIGPGDTAAGQATIGADTTVTGIMVTSWRRRLLQAANPLHRHAHGRRWHRCDGQRNRVQLARLSGSPSRVPARATPRPRPS